MFRENYLGIDIGSGLIKLFHKGRCYKTLTPENGVFRGEIKNSILVAETLKTLVLENKLGGKKAVLAYNGPGVFTKLEKIPSMTEEEIISYLNLEKENLLPFPAKEGVIDYIVINDDGKIMDILVIGLKTSFMIPYIETVKKASLQPVAVDLPSLALARVLFKGEQGLQLVIDVGKTTTDIHIYKDTQFMFSRIINIGGDDFDKVLAASLGIELDQARELRKAGDYQSMIFKGILSELQKELTRSIDYYRFRFGNNESSPFNGVILIGGYSQLQELQETIKEVVGADVIVFNEGDTLLAQGLSMWRQKR
ncbi:type IV pilus assembly protein PilM [Anaerobranca californiensis DSM 14826]|jgi:type IV pilus assembly protein PilM|uniref:Type IV pilus assembly protein PilM n=1 Tax=Anaerobranca californiensis DSM 14826 TaxID=1120989 RepID=A0A1M6LB79_9FIRM|nr:pilus assembly protein PilM [Anaerobranca californiensis]SHJ68471.1 type IV pilus assembly protein PilM [Anaerobranca californiensis DSM 14826]